MASIDLVSFAHAVSSGEVRVVKEVVTERKHFEAPDDA